MANLLPRRPRAGRPTARRPRVALVLGAGGITGIAWLSGALTALREETGWDPATADLITGTSAGAVAATVLAAGEDPVGLLRYAEDPDALEEVIAGLNPMDRARSRTVLETAAASIRPRLGEMLDGIELPVAPASRPLRAVA